MLLLKRTAIYRLQLDSGFFLPTWTWYQAIQCEKKMHMKYEPGQKEHTREIIYLRKVRHYTKIFGDRKKAYKLHEFGLVNGNATGAPRHREKQCFSASDASNRIFRPFSIYKRQQCPMMLPTYLIYCTNTITGIAYFVDIVLHIESLHCLFSLSRSSFTVLN